MVPVVVREAAEDDDLDGLFIPAGTKIMINSKVFRHTLDLQSLSVFHHARRRQLTTTLTTGKILSDSTQTDSTASLTLTRSYPLSTGLATAWVRGDLYDSNIPGPSHHHVLLG